MSTTTRIATLLFSSAFFIVLTGWAQPSRIVTDTVDLDPSGEVELAARAGSVHVQTWDRSSVGVRVRIEAPSTDQLNHTTVSVREESQTVIISPEGEDVGNVGLLELLGMGSSSEGPMTYYTVRIPRRASVNVTSERAEVDIRGVEGEVSVEGVSSPITVQDVTGELTVATFSGSLSVENARGRIRFATFSGNATGRLRAVADNSQFASFSGDVDLTLPADAAFDLRTDVSWGGSVSVDFDTSDSSPTGDGVLSIGGGGPTLEFESFSGSLRLRAES